MAKFVPELYQLDKIQPADRSVVGEKAFHLSQLLQQGYPVIPGVVIPAPALEEFLATIDWSEPLGLDLLHSSLHLDLDNSLELQRVAQTIRQEITSAILPSVWLSTLESILEYWHSTALILRPSLISHELAIGNRHLANTIILNSEFFPRETEFLESHICPRELQALALSLKQAWAELFRARSLFYWQRNNIQLQHLNLAILVQPLWTTTASGYLQANSNTWEIKATSGLIDALYKGEVIPDRYQVIPHNGTIKSRQLGNKNIAYRVVNPTPLNEQIETNGRQAVKSVSILSRTSTCVQTYLLSEEQQKQYALEAYYLQELLQLSQQLKKQFAHNFYLEWALSLASESAEMQVYIMQIHSYNTDYLISSLQDKTVNTNTANNRQLIVTGLAAASGKVTAKAQIVFGYSQNLEAIPSGKILVAKSIAPDWLPLLKNAAGIIAEQGGMTCHAAIIARELGIPAIVGAANATELIQNGQFVSLDGDLGKIYHASMDNGAVKMKILPEKDTVQENLFQVPIATQLLVNLSQSSLIEYAAKLPVDGVGLLRSELMILEVLERQHPVKWLQSGRQQELVERLSQLIKKFASAFAPRPVFYRSLDLRSHEFASLSGGKYQPSIEPNPMLGLRGTFSVTIDPSLFDLELAALVQVQQAGYDNVHLMLPFVRTVEEFVFCRRRIEQAGLTDSSGFQLWIMAEVPSVLFLLPDYVKAGCMGISIGTNDLTQLLLGVDRDQSQMASAFDERHPAVRGAIAQIIQLAKQAGIPCSICGQAPAQYPQLIDELVVNGITSISVEPEAVDRTYKAIARAEQRLLLEAARRQLQQ